MDNISERRLKKYHLSKENIKKSFEGLVKRKEIENLLNIEHE